MNEQLDLSECEREPLRTLGFAQSYGGLIAFGHDRRVKYCSANAAAFFGIEPAQILKQKLDQSCSPVNLALLDSRLPHLAAGIVEHFRWDHLSRPLNAWLHINRNLFVLELENAGPGQDAPPRTRAAALPKFLASAQGANSLQALAQISADAMAEVSAYDRVMIYQFHEDWSGQVIAEHRKPEAEPYLGLRYPATDIPLQARELYTLNSLRVVVDAYSTPAAILSDPGSPPIDLTYSILRSLSPYHLEYLRNMQVTATLTASLIVNGRLWGLIACHHGASKTVAPGLRNAAALIAETTALRIGALQRRTAERAKAKAARQLRAFGAEITSPEKLVEGLCFGQNRLQALFEIDSAAIYTAGGSISIGNAPKAEWIESFAKVLLTLDQDVVSYSDSGGALKCIPCEEAAGALAFVLSRDPGIVVLCFRIEFEHELSWGGDVSKPAIKTPDSQRLSPRKSFAAYKQTIRGQSLPWAGDDLEKARGLLPILRRLLPEDRGLAASIVSRSIQELSDGVPGSSPLYRSLLDLVSEGMSLFIHNHAGSAAPAFATQAMLNQFNLDDHGPEFLLSMADFFRNIGLPEDLLNRMHFGPQEVHVMTGRSANHSYLVELKQILEVTTAQGRVFLAVLTFHNITKYARLLETTEAARLQADHASHIKSAFLANMSHEVRTPMNGILGMAHMLRASALLPEQRDLVEVIERSGQSLLRLVNDILDFSKVEAGKLTLESVPFDLHQLLQDAVRLFRPTARPGVELSLDLASGVPALLIGDPVRLRQVIMNLLGNAIKFTHQGGVTLQVQGEQTSSIYATLDFRVVDTGIGIPEDKIATIFQRFTQAESSTSRNYGGTGLGLAISMQLVTLMGGQIEAASSVGKGTTLAFQLTFLKEGVPVEAPLEDTVVSGTDIASLKSLAGSCGDAEAQPLQPSEAPVRVLVVDDNLINRKVASALLMREGYQVVLAENGAEAIELAQNGSFDVILMDCHMPEMDGYQTTARIRQNEGGGKRTPIIALTASLLEEQHHLCLAAGMDDFLAKPIHPKRFLEVMRKWAALPVETLVLAN